jgi:hypothetical protein
MYLKKTYIFTSIALGWAMLFLSCSDTYEKVGAEKPPMLFASGIAQDFTVTYSETRDLKGVDADTARVLVVMRSPVMKDYENLVFKYREFPNGLELDYFDEAGNKTVITGDYGIVYTQTGLTDLRGNVTVHTHDGKLMETSQLYWDRKRSWLFTDEKFKYTNPEDRTVMDGEGMDVKTDFKLFKAHKTTGLVFLNENDD